MRCLSCDVELTDFESTRKYEGTTEYIDLCNKCFHGLEINNDFRIDLLDVNEIEDKENGGYSD